LPLRESQRGKPLKISSKIEPRLQISKTYGHWEKSSMLKLLKVVNFLARYYYISGGKYSGVLIANSL
jgi:hypothetical protein